MIARLRDRQEWAFFGALHRAAPTYARAWWSLLLLRGILPAVFAVATGFVVAAVEDGDSLALPLVVVGVVFILSQVLAPLHLVVGSNLGSHTSNDLHARLLKTTTEPDGIAHLEDPSLSADLTMARDFELGITGPPLSVAMDFIAGGLVQMVAGMASAAVLFAFAWWAPILLVIGWLSTHWLLRESAVWKDRRTDEVRTAQKHADYSYRLAVDAPASKEVRLFGLSNWVIDRFVDRRRELYELQWKATRLRERSVLNALVVVLIANGVVFWAIGDGAADGRLSLSEVVVFIQAAIATSMIAFGGLNWSLDGASAPVGAIARLEEAMPPRGRLVAATSPQPKPQEVANEIRFHDVDFTYPTGSAPVLTGLDLTIPAGTSMAIVGQNGAGKTTLAKLLCRLYDPSSGTITTGGTDIGDIDIDEWRSTITAVFQDYVRYQLPMRDNVSPLGQANDEHVLAALQAAGGNELAELDTILAKGYHGGTDLSGGQWQRVAIARALCAVELGAGLVLLDEPTAQLDVRGEAEIFERVLQATRGVTTILISHRFSTVRQADAIAVVEHGRVIELGSHDELMELGGRYHTMFELQASRFGEAEYDEAGNEVTYESL